MQICYTEMENLLEFTIHFRESYSQPQWTVLNLCEGRVLLVWADLPLFYVGSSIQNSSDQIHLLYQLCFFKLRPSSKPTNSNLMKSARQNQTVTIHNKTRVHANVFLTMTQTITPEITFVSSWITLSVCACVCVFCVCMYVNGWLHSHEKRHFNYTFKINLLGTLVKYMIDEDYYLLHSAESFLRS
jgi:hypothetical protein